MQVSKRRVGSNLSNIRHAAFSEGTLFQKSITAAAVVMQAVFCSIAHYRTLARFIWVVREILQTDLPFCLSKYLEAL